MSASAHHHGLLAPPLRITRRGGRQRPHIPRAKRAAYELARVARLEAESAARAALESQLPALRASLLASPYWNEALGRAGLAPNDIGALGDLADFPLLDRQTLADRWRDVAAIEIGTAAGLVTVGSSGSSGEPLTVLRDEYECVHMWAVLRFWLEWHRIALPERPRVVLLCALTGGIEYSVRLPIFENGALHRLTTTRADAARRLRRARPAVIFSDPAGLHWLAALENPPQPQLILSSAQHLPDALRTRLERKIRAPVLDYYSTTETGPLAWACLERPDRRHVLVPEVWVESVEGELVVTRLRSSPFPLLRYRTGDRGRVEHDKCSCGYRGWSIRGFSGRHACAFITPEGARVDAWRLAWLFKHYALRDFRLTQQTADRFILELAGRQDARGARDTDDLQQRLTRALGQLGWKRPRLELHGARPRDRSVSKPEPFRCCL